MSRAKFILEQLEAAIAKEIEAEANRKVKIMLEANNLKICGLDYDQIAALKRYFMREVALDPADLRPSEIFPEKHHD